MTLSAVHNERLGVRSVGECVSLSFVFPEVQFPKWGVFGLIERGMVKTCSRVNK